MKFLHILMTVFEYILLLFKRPGVPGKTEERLLNSPKPMTENFTFKREHSLNDRITPFLHPNILDKYT